MNRRIAICWAFSTGKTTLINWITHPYKIVDLERNVENLNPVTQSREFNIKLNKIIRVEESKSRDFITNNSYIDNLAYTAISSKEDYDNLSRIANQYDLAFYLPIEFNIEDDWYRHIDKSFQLKIDEIIRWHINKYSKEVIVITWNIEERIEKVNLILWNK